MRITFSKMLLFKDDHFKQETSFIFNGKELGVGKQEGERERERVRCRMWVGKGCGIGHELDHWSIIYEGLETG
jgi:hypothetical protein